MALERIEGWWARRVAGNRLAVQKSRLEMAVDVLRWEYELFELAVSQGEVNPLIYYLRIVLAVFSFLTSLSIYLTILLTLLSHPPLSRLLLTLHTHNLPILSLLLLTLLHTHLLLCTLSGHLFLSTNLPSILSFYPMKVNGTWMNAMIVNAWVGVLGGCGVMGVWGEVVVVGGGWWAGWAGFWGGVAGVGVGRWLWRGVWGWVLVGVVPVFMGVAIFFKVRMNAMERQVMELKKKVEAGK
jgi:hypothetical protein